MDTLLLQLHIGAACRHGGALALRPVELDPEQCLTLLRKKDEPSGGSPCLVELAAIVAVLGAAWLVLVRSWEWAFVATTVTIGGMVLSIFSALYPNVLISTLDPADNLTVNNASSAPYSLKVMTIIVVIFLPVALAYQIWAYHVFRQRITAPT